MIVIVKDKVSRAELMYFENVEDITNGLVKNSVCIQTKKANYVFIVRESEMLEIIKEKQND